MSRRFILLPALVFLLVPLGGARAQLTVAGPASPAARAVTAWAAALPAKFAPKGRLEVSPLSEGGMDNYLRDGGPEQSRSDQSRAEDDDDEIDGVFVRRPPRIVLRVPDSGRVDFGTLAHEYGHYVWFDLLTKNDRNRYGALYARQKAAHKLVTPYAADSVEEGFAEAFAADLTDPALLLRADPLSAQFLSRWPKP